MLKRFGLSIITIMAETQIKSAYESLTWDKNFQIQSVITLVSIFCTIQWLTLKFHHLMLKMRLKFKQIFFFSKISQWIKIIKIHTLPFNPLSIYTIDFCTRVQKISLFYKWNSLLIYIIRKFIISNKNNSTEQTKVYLKTNDSFINVLLGLIKQ